MRVPERHTEGLVPQDLLDLFQRAPTHGQVTRRRVPQIVEPEVGQSRPFDGLLEGGPNLPPALTVLSLEYATDACL